MPQGLRREQFMGGEGRSRGKDFEQDLFGRPRIEDPIYQRKLSEVRDKKTGYVPFDVAISLLVGIQPKARPFAFKLAHEIAKQLGNN